MNNGDRKKRIRKTDWNKNLAFFVIFSSRPFLPVYPASSDPLWITISLFPVYSSLLYPRKTPEITTECCRIKRKNTVHGIPVTIPQTPWLAGTIKSSEGPICQVYGRIRQRRLQLFWVTLLTKPRMHSQRTTESHSRLWQKFQGRYKSGTPPADHCCRSLRFPGAEHRCGGFE